MAYRTQAAIRMDAENDILFRREMFGDDDRMARTSHSFADLMTTTSLVSSNGGSTTVSNGGFDWVAYAAALKHDHGHGDGFAFDGVGDDKDGPLPTLPLLITTDLQPQDTSTTATLTVDGAHVISSIDMIADEDWFAVTFEAGQTYDISMFLTTSGPNLVPLADAYIELYDAGGTFLLSADGGGPNTPSGLDAIMTYTAQASGTYYVNARAFDNVPADGTRGDFVGDYELFVTSVDESDPTAYVPFYSPDSPLHSIDWGSVFDRSSRNPDGDNGSRPNYRVPDGGTPITNNEYGITGKNVISYYFAKQGDVFVDEEPGGLATMIQAKDMLQWEKDAFRAALDLYENVADIIYIEVDNRAEADLKFITYQGTPGVGASLLGRMSPPNEPNEGQAEFNSGDVRWTEEGVSQGGFYFSTLLHEFGHGHGMAHPHDNGGRSSIMRGAGPSDDPVEGAIGGQLGDYDLSQQVFTIMSYNDGWQTSPYGGPSAGGITGTDADPFGWMGSLGALDIAVIQDKYGVNEDYNSGANIYSLKDVNAAGTFYSTIWDGGGTDEIRYTGARDANIDLRAASLQYEEGGGGWMNYATGIYGGYTIANGVVIENGTTGSGNDSLRGNDANNTLRGNAGNDTIGGFGGNDRLEGGAGDDSLDGGLGNDNLIGGDGNDSLTDTGGTTEQLYGQNGDDVLSITRAAGGTGNFVLDGGAGADRFVLGALSGITQAKGGADNDRFEAHGAATVTGGTGVDTIRIEGDFASGAVVAVEDFTAGAGGDRLDLSAFMTARFTGWDGVANPTSTGHVRVVASATGSTVQVDLNGGGNSWTTIATLKGVSPGQLTAENLGFALSGGANGITGTAGNDILNGSNGVDIILGLQGDDTLKGNGGNDELQGDGGKDKLYGLDGDDALYGGDDIDQMLGGNGDDALYGEAGDDIMVGGFGKDSLTGGLGKDSFSYSLVSESAAGAADRILDFNASQGDKLNLKSVDADTGVAGDQAFVFVSAFDGHAAQAVRAYDGVANLTTLSFDVNGDAVADMVIELNGNVTSGWIL
jgi:serralysin